MKIYRHDNEIVDSAGMRVFFGLRDDPFYFDSVAFGETIASEGPGFVGPAGINSFAPNARFPQTGSSGTAAVPAPVPPATFTGTFVDGIVSGLSYQTDSGDPRLTSSRGEFEFVANEDLRFFIGACEFGSTPGAAFDTV